MVNREYTDPTFYLGVTVIGLVIIVFILGLAAWLGLVPAHWLEQ